MSRAGIIEKSLHRRGALIKVKNLDEACEIAKPDRSGTLGAVGLRIRGNGLKKSATPARFSRAVHLGGSGGLLRRAEPRLADFAHGRFSSPLGVYDFRNARAHFGLAQRRAKARQVAMTLANGKDFSTRAVGRAQIRKNAQGSVSAGPEKVIRDEIRALNRLSSPIARAW